jgi:hypothetical protein
MVYKKIIKRTVELEVIELYKTGEHSTREISRMKKEYPSHTTISTLLKSEGIPLINHRSSAHLKVNKGDRFLRIKMKEWGFKTIEEAREHFESTGINKYYLDKHDKKLIGGKKWN